MALDNEFDGKNDIAQFLEKFKEQPFPPQVEQTADSASGSSSVRPSQYARSFEKLEQKIHELEEKFEASTTQNHLILSELARTREVVERQKDKDAFLEHLSRTIATLRTSVENLSRTQENNTFSYHGNTIQRSFDPLPDVMPAPAAPSAYPYPIVDVQAQLQLEREEQTRRFNSLRQKASQLKAVNSALDREIKKAQQEKMDALKKSADQAREILSLRDQLSAAEERFKSFDFEGRIISVKQEYQQKVATLENRLKEMSDTCMKHVEEIESLKVENIKLQNASAEKESLQKQLADKEQELSSLRETIASLQNQNSGEHTKRLVAFTAQLRALEEQRDRLAIELEQSQMSLESIRHEKDMLEKNFKELVAKISENDTVIEQLKQKIEVLGAQNTQLSQQNEELTQANTVLSRDNESLSQTNVELTNRNAALTQHNSLLSRQTQTLEGETASLKGYVEKLNKDNQELAEKTQQLAKDNEQLVQHHHDLSNEHNNLQTQAQSWKNEAQTLSQENQQLRNQSAALLAARLVQEHNKKQTKQHAKQDASFMLSTNPSLQIRKPQAPVLHSLGRTIPLSSSQTEEEWEMISTKVSAPVDNKTRIQTQDDLPEIKVAQQSTANDLFDGEDFLEKTDSFIGRMKWSIFHENR